MVAPPEPGAHEDDIASLDHTRRIPNELLHHVVDYLPASQLLLVSSVSRRFRGVITRDSRFCITIRIKVTHRNIFTNICSRHVAHAHAILEYAIPEQLPVAMMIVCQDVDPVGALATLRNYMCDSVFPIVRAALPMLVRLAVEIPDEHSDALQAVLLQPAPLLRHLKLSRITRPSYPKYGSEDDSDHEAEPEHCAHVVPRNIFSGIAPQLLRVSFCNISFTEGPIPAFSSVRCVALRYDYHSPDIRISRLFPCIAELEIEFEASEYTHAPPASIDYSGISLKHLHIGDLWSCRLLATMTGSLDLALIPAITYTSFDGCQDDQKTLLDSIPGAVTMRMRDITEPGLDSGLEFRAMRDGYRRVFRFEKLNSRTLENFSIFAFRVVDIRLEYWLIRVLLNYKCDFPVLRRVRLDYSRRYDVRLRIEPLWFDIDNTHVEDDNRSATVVSNMYLIRCPLLDAVAFTAPDFDRKISPRQVASIGHALGQSERPREARARLEMFGVTFVEHARRELLDLIFPHIVYHSREEILDWGEDVEWPRTG